MAMAARRTLETEERDLGWTAPVVTGVRHRAEAILVSWRHRAAILDADRYVVSLTRRANGTDTPWGNHVVAGNARMASLEARPDAPFEPDATFLARVTPLSGESFGPSSGAVPVAHALRAPIVTAVVCDGRALSLTWDDPTPEPRPALYEVIFQGVGAPVVWSVAVRTADRHASLQIAPALDPLASATLRIRGRYGVSSAPGPESEPVEVFVEPL